MHGWCEKQVLALVTDVVSSADGSQSLKAGETVERDGLARAFRKLVFAHASASGFGRILYL